MDPQKRHLKKLKKLQKVRRDKLKERNQKKKSKRGDKNNRELKASEITSVVDKNGKFSLRTYLCLLIVLLQQC